MIQIHPADVVGEVKPLNGVNLGPVDRYWTRDYTTHYRQAKIPSVRVHDASLSVPDTVELHCIFPNVGADPDDPASYQFGPTDGYFAAIRESGATIDFRIGEAIDHGPSPIWINPDRWTPELMARVTVNIARHYNDGWADGHHWNIGRWTFWEEPDGPKLWAGDADTFYRFYAEVARGLKTYDPSLHVGLAAFTAGFVRRVLNDPVEANRWSGVLPRCAAEAVPVDFVSWNYYGASWRQLVANAHGMRAYLDQHGLGDAENHIAEWNFSPNLTDEDGEYRFMTARVSGNYRRIEAATTLMSGPVGAGFVFCAMTALQDAPVEAAHIYIGTVEPWGLFTPHGGPNLKYRAFEEFGRLRSAGPRVRVEQDDHVATLAVVQDDRLIVAVAHDEPRAETVLHINGANYRVGEAKQLGPEGWSSAEWIPRSGPGPLVLPAADPGITVIEFV